MAFSLLAHAVAGSAAGVTVTTAALNTTGANLLVVTVASYGSQATLTDSAGNTWVLDVSSISGGGVNAYLYHCYAPTTSATHTFTASFGSTTYPALDIMAFSGSASSPLDQTVASGSNGSVTITPTVANEVVIVGLSSGGGAVTPTCSGFSFPDSVGQNGAGSNLGCSMGYQIQTTATTVGPTTVSGVGGPTATAWASFKSGGAATPASVQYRSLLGVGV